jgi:thioredoxin-related protein
MPNFKFPMPEKIKLNCLIAFLVMANLFCSLTLANCADDKFGTDVAAAVSQAEKENKDLMLFFTGSDWCPPCQKLEAEVFSQPEFFPGVKDNYVLVMLDFPKSVKLPEKIQQQNEAMATKFGVANFPTVIMVDTNLKPFAFAGYQEGGAENFIKVMIDAHQKRITRDENLAAAQKQTGSERAQLLDAAISGLGEEIVSVYYTDVVDEIVSLDKNNELGLREKWNAAADNEMRKVILADMLVMSRIAKPEQTMNFIDEVLNEITFSDAQRLKILQIKLNLAREIDQTETAAKVLDQMIALDGITGSTQQRLVAKKAYVLAGAGQVADAIGLLDRQIAASQDRSVPDIGYLFLAKGELLGKDEKWQAAATTFSDGIAATPRNFDLLIDLVGAKSDVLFAAGKQADALRLLDEFSDNQSLPEDLRAEALLQKAMLMRKLDRGRQARLSENRAIEIVKSPTEKAAVKKMVDLLRSKYD